MYFLSHPMVMEQQQMCRGNLLGEADRRFRVGKLLAKRMCKSPSLRAKVCKKGLKRSTPRSRHSCEKPGIRCVLPLFALHLYIWEHLDHHCNLSSAQMLDISSVGPAACTQQELSMIHSFSNNYNQLPGFQ